MTRTRVGGRVSLAQRGVWVTERAGGCGSAYHLAMTVAFDPGLDVIALTRAVDDVVARQPMLGAAFADDAGVPMLVAAAFVPSLRIVPVPPGGVDGFVRDAVARPFDLGRGPLARFALATLGDGRTVLVVVAHHLIFDGASKDLLLAELAAAYAGAVGAGAVGAMVDPADHDGHVAAQESRVAALDDAARAFWRSRWRDSDQVLLPETAPMPVRADVAVRFTLDPVTDQRLREVSAAIGVTRFEWLLAALQALLWRYGNAEPMVAVDLSTRTGGTADHIGLWVNELPTRATPEADQTWRDFATTVRADIRAIYPFREVPLSRAVTGLTSRAAVAPVSISYRRGTTPALFAGTDATIDALVFPQTARNALHLQVIDGATGAEMSLHSPAGLADATRIAGHLRTLLTATIGHPDAKLADLPLISATELAEMRAVNETARPVPPVTVVDLFEARVRATPDAPALTHAGTALSYGELNTAANRVAHGLRRRGVSPGDLVALRLRRGPELVTALLGVLKAGAAYLPLDPAYPAQRLAFIVADAGAALTLSDGEPFVAGAQTDPEPARTPDDLAYVIYTSGSTGQPKGVEITHGSLVNLLLAMADTVGATPADRWLSLTSLSFDISALEILLPLITGACVVIAPEVATREGAALDRLIRAERVTHVQATPSTWQMLLAAGFESADVVGLCGGESLPGLLADKLRARLRRLFHVYGPTETTIWSTVAEIPAVAAPVTIGRPLANTTVRVFDDRMRPVPAGVPGELWLGGAGLARGYRGRPDLTAERFVADPASAERLYRTGDRVVRLADGTLRFLGRVDNQVKLRGHRIELGEIERTLLDCPGIESAAVSPRADEAGEPRLVAYVVGTRVDVAALRHHLATTLPRYMMPAAFVQLASMPLTPNGKLDRAALPEPEAVVVPEAPADGDVVARVAAIWREVLRVEDIASDDSLFDLGGHSLDDHPDHRADPQADRRRGAVRRLLRHADDRGHRGRRHVADQGGAVTTSLIEEAP